MDNNNSDKNPVNETQGKVKVSGADAFKPTTTKELDLVRKRAQKESNEKELVSEMQSQQRTRKKLLADCQTLLNVNYEWLELDDYPDNRAVSLAKRTRDYWLFSCVVLLVFFLAGVLELVPAWLGGSAFGLLFITYCFSIKGFRRFFFKDPTLSELLKIRKQLEFRALNHIKLLEGQDGLAWRCRKLVKYNSNLGRRIFRGVMDVSAKKRLFGVIREKKHIRLYLQLMLEAEKAYKRLQSEFLKHHFKNLENGVDDMLSKQPLASDQVVDGVADLEKLAVDKIIVSP